MLARWAPEVEQPEGDLDARDVMDAVHAAYRVERKALAAEADETGDDTALRARDEAYLAALEQVDSIRPRGIFEATVGHVTGSFNELVRGLVTLDLKEFFSGVQNLFVRTPICLWGHDKIFTIVYGLLFVLLVAVGGGALSRMAAVDVAQGEKLRLQEALDFALGGWTRLVLSLLLPLLIAAGRAPAGRRVVPDAAVGGPARGPALRRGAADRLRRGLPDGRVRPGLQPARARRGLREL